MTTAPAPARPLLDHLAVFVNGSDSSLAAFEHGARLASVSGARLEAVLIEDVALPAFMSWAEAETLARLVGEVAQTAHAAADELQRRIGRLARAAGVAATITRDAGSFFDKLVEYAAPASLLLIGRSPRWESGGLLGRNSESVVREVRRPVLIAPEAHVDPASVLVAYAGKDLGPLVLANGAELAGALGVPMRVLMVDPDRERRARTRVAAEETLGQFEGPIEFIEEDRGHAATRIAAHSSDDALLVMGAVGRRLRVSRLLLGSVTASVMRDARGPVVLTAKPAG